MSDTTSTSRFLVAVEAFDARIDALFEPLRGNPSLDTAAKIVTGAGDHGLMWAALTLVRMRRHGSDRARAVKALGIAGISSSLVNAGIKGVVGRSRPDTTDLGVTEGGVPVRAPKTSSFPSGHTLAAFTAATVLSESSDGLGTTLLFASASAVGISRLYLRAHHASDVVGGVVIGTTLGIIGRRFV